MFLNIPEDVFSTQINGNVEEALKVLKVTSEKLERKSRRFSRDLSLDPENPITQVSRTPSDEEFPWQWDDIFPDDDVTATNTNGYKETIQQTEVTNKTAIDFQDGKEEKTVNIDSKSNNIGTCIVEKDIEDKGNIPSTKASDDKIIVQPSAEVEEIAEDKQKNGSEDMNTKNDETALDAKKDDKPVLKRPSTSAIRSKCLVADVVRFITGMKIKIPAQNLETRIIPSNAACRFELPTDMTRLKGENPLSYLIKYCYATETRKAVYTKEYDKYTKIKGRNFLTLMDLEEIYESILHEKSWKEELLHLRRLLNLDYYIELDVDMFIKFSCFMERIVVKNQRRRVPVDYKKNPFEVVDFCGLKAKLHGIELTQEMLTFLEYIRECHG